MARYMILDRDGVEEFDSQVAVFFALLGRGGTPTSALLRIGQCVQMDLQESVGGSDDR